VPTFFVGVRRKSGLTNVPVSSLFFVCVRMFFVNVFQIFLCSA